VHTLTFGTPVLGRVPRPQARHRLVCLPFPGGAASGFLPWVDLLPADVELSAVQLAGREDRFGEQPRNTVAEIVAEIVHSFEHDAGPPLAFFGHSGGALLAYEVVRALRASGHRQPVRLFVSAEPPPDAPRTEAQLHQLNDKEFSARIRSRGGTAPEILANEELMELILPTLRADFTWYETYEWTPSDPLDCPVTAFASPTDPIVDLPEVRGWSAHTTGDFEFCEIVGGHYFVLDAMPELVARIVDTLQVSAA
jgi:medium-chain acyl-[acyl-carrier-protein] hydrolase